MNITEFCSGKVDKKVVAIVQFGPPTENSGMQAGQYFQVTIDPEKISPSGAFIRLGETKGDQIVGWQRCSALTVVEVLGEWDQSDKDPMLAYGDAGAVTMMLGAGVPAQLDKF